MSKLRMLVNKDPKNIWQVALQVLAHSMEQQAATLRKTVGEHDQIPLSAYVGLVADLADDILDIRRMADEGHLEELEEMLADFHRPDGSHKWE